MAKFDRYEIEFDNGDSVVVQSRTRDILKLEREGVVVGRLRPVEGTYMLAFEALVRRKKAGEVEFDIPGSALELMEVADIVVLPDVVDAEGNDSAPEAITG